MRRKNSSHSSDIEDLKRQNQHLENQVPINWLIVVPKEISRLFCSEPDQVAGEGKELRPLRSGCLDAASSSQPGGERGGNFYCVTRAPLFYFIRSWVAISFKVCQSVSEWVRHWWHLSRSPLCSMYEGINALYWPSIINYQLLTPGSVL